MTATGNARQVHAARHLAEVYDFLGVFGAVQNLRPRYKIALTTSIDGVRLAPEGWREWLVDRRVNRTGFGDDDPTLLDPIAASLL